MREDLLFFLKKFSEKLNFHVPRSMLIFIFHEFVPHFSRFDYDIAPYLLSEFNFDDSCIFYKLFEGEGGWKVKFRTNFQL